MYTYGVHSFLCFALLVASIDACPAKYTKKHHPSSSIQHGTSTNINTFSARSTISSIKPSSLGGGMPSVETSSSSKPTSIGSQVSSAKSSVSSLYPSSGKASSTPVPSLSTSSSAITSSTSSSSASPSASAPPLTPDNTCGGASGYTCNPNDPLGGACCSASGFCGNGDAYCGVGCQPNFGTCSTTPGGTVPGLGYFSNFRTYNFESGVFPTQDLLRSDYRVNDTVSNVNARFDHSFVPANVVLENGYLVLTVPGGQNTSPITGGEVQTVAENILYASVRTTAILTQEPGVVDGFFFYHDDCQEIDIEYLPDASSASNPQGQPIPLQYTNQALSCQLGAGTHTTRPAPADAQTAEHEYRYDWVPGRVDFYTDGVLQDTFTTNVPTEPGAVLWNIWTNGDPGFSVGPPVQNAVLQIKEIVMYYNTTA